MDRALRQRRSLITAVVASRRGSRSGRRRGSQPGTFAYSINKAGAITGSYVDASNVRRTPLGVTLKTRGA